MLVDAGERNDEARSAVGRVEGLDGSVVAFNNAFHNGKAQSCAAGVACAGVVAAIETREQKLRVNIAKAGAVIDDADNRFVGQTRKANGYVSAFAHEAARIGDQVVNRGCPARRALHLRFSALRRFPRKSDSLHRPRVRQRHADSHVS